MDREIILASHGKFASGILDSLELIYGKIILLLYWIAILMRILI